jgi:hypothetical protein
MVRPGTSPYRHCCCCCCCCCCYYYRFDPIRLRFDWISIGCRFGTNCTRFRISFDSILFQFDFAPPVTLLLLFESICCTSSDVLLLYQTLIMWDECKWNRKSPGTEVRFDLIWLGVDLILIRRRFGTNSTRLRMSFDSILFQFDLIWLCTSCDDIIIIIKLLFNLFHYIIDCY